MTKRMQPGREVKLLRTECEKNFNKFKFKKKNYNTH